MEPSNETIGTPQKPGRGLPFTTKKFAYATILIALVLVVGVALLVRPRKTVAPAPRKATIRITTDGFSPSTLTVSKGTQIMWRNDDAAPHRVASNPYPVDDKAALDSGVITPGGSYSFTAKAGETLSYHDETNPEHNATIVVQE
jgi:plastocyanin